MYMKRFLSILLAAVLLTLAVLLTACGKEKNTTENTLGDTGPEQTDKDPDETTGKEIVLQGEFTQRQQQILLCGGLLNYTKENG